MDMQRATRVSACVMQVMKLGKCGKASGKYDIGKLTRLSNYEYACSMQNLVLLKCRGVWALTCICMSNGFCGVEAKGFYACLVSLIDAIFSQLRGILAKQDAKRARASHAT